jgi:hypothetical protein
MSDEPQAEPFASSDDWLRSRQMTGPITRDTKRFDIFLIDTCWNESVSKAVRSHLRHLFSYKPVDTFYELSREQSFEILQRDPHLIGHDPTIIVYDLYAPPETKRQKYHGFRLNLGLMKNGVQALARLQEFIRFVETNRTAHDLDRVVRRELQREGIDGMIRVLRETSTELLVE